ncbi:DUF4097 family beta strand repeat-containing protein [Mycolicibacterium sp.]|uniref:DUF4097 family beta strand repeat-containing protein n=1 Tax=Mycolicibacterium sp. TaxID=2320850 RepID=UPI001A20DA3D|nr:DUF4097 family beta strand repeat-containing protein [Mycolicibacterium sp.]MBJ7337966.1 DUF4097 family beta strand repeat protein [Mycolicibacterium sp.]
MTIIAPPPPAAAPPPLSPGGRTALRVVLVVAASVLIVGCVLALGVTSWGLGSLRVAADEKALPSNTKALVIDIGDVPAAVRITADREAREPRVRMRLLNSSRSGDHNLVVSDDAGTTRLTVDGATLPFAGWDGSPLGDFDSAGEINVILPPDQARRLSLTVREHRGMLLTQTDLDQIVVDSTDGDVVLGGGARRVEIHTQNGDVTTRGSVSVTDSFAVDSTDGDLSVDFTDAAPHTVDVTTTNGDVAISLPQPGPYLVRAAGDAPLIRVPQTDDAARAAATVTVRSDTGDIEVRNSGRG